MKLLLLLSTFLATAAARSSRVVGGIDATPHAWPHQASLRVPASDGSGRISHICGASVLNANHVITAAHCVDGHQTNPSRFTVVAGAHLLSSTTQHEQAVVVSNVLMHPSYDPNSLGYPNDLAILRLSQPLVLNAGVAAANLPEDDSDTFAGRNCYITGWGRTSGSASNLPDVLQQVQIPVVTNSQCSGLLPFLVSLGLRTTHVCIADPNLQAGACNGDSGGPLVCPNSSGSMRLVGVTSWGVSGCDTRYPSVYVRTSKYLSWIASNS